MTPGERYHRYRELQKYVAWTHDDAKRVAALDAVLFPYLSTLVDDFYAEIERHPPAQKVISGGPKQVERLKLSLLAWLKDLLSGKYDAEYVLRRWRVGWRHVEIGLDQVYTNVALSRLRAGLLEYLQKHWSGRPTELHDTVVSLNKLLDLDLAIIEDAYQAEYFARHQRSERLAAIGQVAGGIAHELRNPLNVIKTSIYYLLNSNNQSKAKTEEHLHRIERHVAVSDNVIQALSNFARMPLPDLQSFGVAQLLREVLETNAMPENVQIEFEISDSLPGALADREQLRIVFSNLVRNAFEAMPEGGTLSLRGFHRSEGVEIEVADNGVGIAPENLPRILEPLFSTKARGLGLGLALVRAILEKNQGSLRLTSELGKGSTFTVRLLTDGR